MTPELDFHARAFTPVDISHFLGFNTGDFSARSTTASISKMGYMLLYPKVSREKRRFLAILIERLGRTERY